MQAARALKHARHSTDNIWYSLFVQPVLAVPAGKRARRIHALALALPLDQRGHGRARGVGALELVAEVFIVGVGGVADDGGVARQGALDLVVVDGRVVVLRREDGRAGHMRLLLNGQRQAGRAAEVRRGHDILLQRGIGGVYRRGGVVGPAAGRLFAGGRGHVDGPGLRRGRVCGRCVRRRGALLGRAARGQLRRGAAGAVARAVPLLLGGLGLFVAHGVVRGRLGAVAVAVLRGAEVVGDGGAGGDGNRLRAPTRLRAGRRRRGVRLGVGEGRGRRRGLRLDRGQGGNRLSPARRVVEMWDMRDVRV
jgi:hypothetical protein